MRVCLTWLLMLVACGKGDTPPPPSSGALLTQESGPNQPVGSQRAPIRHDGPVDAHTVFNNQCAMCHGRDGRGDGISAGALTVKPRNYADAKWQASVTDDEIKQIIVLGGKAVGKHESMPPNPDLAKQPEVLGGLVAIIRGFGKK
jgi:mono/diheme cytochrome c family protein